MSVPCPVSMLSGGGKPAVVFVMVVLVAWALIAAQSNQATTPAQPQR